MTLPPAVVFDVGGVLLLPSGRRVASVVGQVTGLELDPVACRDGWTRALSNFDLGRQPWPDLRSREVVGSAHTLRAGQPS